MRASPLSNFEGTPEAKKVAGPAAGVHSGPQRLGWGSVTDSRSHRNQHHRFKKLSKFVTMA